MCYPERDTFVLNIVARGNASHQQSRGDEGRNKTSGMAVWWIYNAPPKPQTPREKQFLENNQQNDRALFSPPYDPRGETSPHTVTNGSGVKRSFTVIHHLTCCECNHSLGRVTLRRVTLNQLVSNNRVQNSLSHTWFCTSRLMTCPMHPQQLLRRVIYI